ncbi:MAG: CotH kinase family protein [Bacteroidota bacterium]
MKAQILFLLFLLSNVYAGHSQTFSGSGGSIPDNGDSVVFTINVSGLSPSVIDTNFGLQSVCINLIHTWDSDLHIELIAPDGTHTVLTSGNGNDGDDYVNTCFVDTATVSVIAGTAPFTGDYRPQEDMGFVNNGQNGNGVWTLYILDTYPFADIGALLSWNITFGTHPATATKFVSSDLPIILIETWGQIIPDDPKIQSGFAIINNGPGVRNYVTDPVYYKGNIGIELRGSSSQMFPKKSYGLETTDTLGSSIDTALLGLPSENDWILNANYTDKTLMRNPLSYTLWEKMGHYATRGRYCELLINGKYQGVYYFQEKIKRDKNRIPISKLTTLDNSGDALTGGYIVKIDKSTGSGGDGWTSSFLPPVNSSGQTIFFQYDYPDEIDITATQKNYIQAYVDSFETALADPQFNDPQLGFRRFASDSTFVDYLIMNEISKNVDGYRLSTFLYKNRYSKDGRIHIGPVWDYDIAWHNANYCGGDDETGWAYDFPCSGDTWQPPFWWARMLQDPSFTSLLKCRWNDLRSTILSTTSLNHFIDSVALLIDESKTRNFDQWPIIGVYVWPNPAPYPTTYAGEIINLKAWLVARLGWLDANMPGICNTGSSTQITSENVFNIFPNPAQNKVSFSSKSGQLFKPLSLTNALGESIFLPPSVKENGVVSLDISQLPSGLYMLIVQCENSLIPIKFMKAE